MLCSDALSSSSTVVVNVLEPDHPLKQRCDDVDIVGSCNGLVCLVNWSHTVFIWNPSTRKYNTLPAYPLTNAYSYGFGYNESTDDHKVVAVSSETKSLPYETKSMLYSFKTGKWKHIASFPLGMPEHYSCRFSNGALYWRAKHQEELFTSWKILPLDLATETYREILQPVYDDDDDDDDKDFHLGTLGESLCVLCNYRRKRADVWVMKTYGVNDSSWTKLISIPYLTGPEDKQFFEPLFISNGGKILFRYARDLLVYDSKNSSFSKIRNFDGCLEVCTFVESLVSPHASTGIEDNNDDRN